MKKVTSAMRTVLTLFCTVVLMFTSIDYANAQKNAKKTSQKTTTTGPTMGCQSNNLPAGYGIPTATYQPQCRPTVTPRFRFAEGANEVQQLLQDAQQVTKIGTLPNGDKFYLATGLEKRVDTTPVTIGGGITVVTMGYCTRECLLMYSNQFDRWDVFAFNPSIAGTDSSFVITSASIQPDWHIAVTFTGKQRTIQATYRLDLKKFVYRSTEDEYAIEGEPRGFPLGSFD